MPPGEQCAPLSSKLRHYNEKFLNKRNQKIFCYYWRPIESPRALLLISHGFTEHCMMYDALGNEMARRGFFVFAHDHVGHGKTDGFRGYVEDIRHLVEDTISHIKKVKEEFPNVPLFLCGFSMGGSVSALTILTKEVGIKGAVLIAPALKPNPETATFFRVTFAKLMNYFAPHFPVAFTDYSLSCQDKAKVKEMDEDPLRYHGYWKVRPIMNLLQSGEEILRRSKEVEVPFLILHGDGDKICHLSGSKKFYEKASSEDKTIKIYPGGYHSLLHEPQDIGDDAFNQTVLWLDARA